MGFGIVLCILYGTHYYILGGSECRGQITKDDGSTVSEDDLRQEGDEGDEGPFVLLSLVAEHGRCRF